MPPSSVQGPPDSRLQLRLYVAGEAANSIAARTNLRRMLAGEDPSTYRLEVIDCLEDPVRALEDGVLVTPTLIRAAPPPAQTIIGSLSEARRVTAALGLPMPGSAPAAVDDGGPG
jgi:circadian clock protein KaiB